MFCFAVETQGLKIYYYFLHLNYYFYYIIILRLCQCFYYISEQGQIYYNLLMVVEKFAYVRKIF